MLVSLKKTLTLTSIDVESVAREVHSASLLPKVAAKRKPQKGVDTKRKGKATTHSTSPPASIKLIAFNFMTDSTNAVEGHNRRLRHVVSKFDFHKSTTELKVHIS